LANDFGSTQSGVIITIYQIVNMHMQF